MSRVLLGLLLAASVASAQPAPPADPVARAKQLYADGKRFYDVADYAKAIAAWKEAYVIASAPMLLFNIGQAYRLSGDCAQALRFYASYEREAPQPTNRDELEEARTRCDPRPTNANPPDAITVPPTPTDPPSAVAKPSPPVVVAPPPPPPPHAREEDDPGATQRTLGIATGATGLVLIGTSLYLGHRASATADQVSAFTGPFTTERRDLDQHGHTLGTWSVVTGIAGVVGLASGAALYVLGRSSPVDVSVSSHSAGVSWSGSF